MRQINVKLKERSYNILIENKLKHKFKYLIKEKFKGEKIAIITDEKIYSIYHEFIENELVDESCEFKVIKIASGESNKNMSSVTKVYNELADFEITRGDLIVTFGGGVVGDLGGFVAATYLRGIPFIQIPTTLLAQVDSSVGGKVGVDLEQGKNLVGQFYQPLAVLIDTSFLDTLEDRIFYDGMAEVIKYGCIKDAEFLNRISADKSRKDLMQNIDEIVAICCQIKASIVELDEFDMGERMILNFGHTIGHGIEKYYNYNKYTHGEAVAIGMMLILKLGASLGLCKQKDIDALEKVLKTNQLPTTVEFIDWEILSNIIKNDKKKSGSSISVILLNDIGNAKISSFEWEVFKESMLKINR